MSKAFPNTPPARPATDFPKGIGNPATNALVAAGYTRLAQLAKVSEAELQALHCVGPKAIRVLREVLAERGLSFAAKPSKKRP
jgi:predicted flap endonuclease-1-like 5' DNA nuclease